MVCFLIKLSVLLLPTHFWTGGAAVRVCQVAEVNMGTDSTLSGEVKRLANSNPEQVVISFLGEQDLTFYSLDQLVDEIASRLLSFGIQRGDVAAIAFGNTVELFITILAVMRCRGVALTLHPDLAQEEFEFYLSYYEGKLLLTGPGSNQPAAGAAAARRIPHVTASLDFASNSVLVSFVPTSAPGEHRVDPAAVGLDKVVNKTWDAALLLHVPGAMSSGYRSTLTQQQLASCVWSRTDVVNLSQEPADPRFAGVHLLLQNLGFLKTLTSAMPKGSLGTSPESAAMVGTDAGIRGAEESELKLKDVLAISAGAVIAVSSTLLNKQLPEAAAEKATIPLLCLYGAVTLSLGGQLLKVSVGRFHWFFKAAAVFLFYCGGAALAVSVLPRPYSHAALAVTLATAAGSSISAVLVGRTAWGTKGAGNCLTRWLTGKLCWPKESVLPTV